MRGQRLFLRRYIDGSPIVIAVGVNLVDVGECRADDFVESINRQFVGGHLGDEIDAVFGTEREMQFTQLVIFGQEIAIERLVSLLRGPA